MDGVTSFIIESAIVAILGWIIISNKKQDDKHPELYFIFKIFVFIGLACAVIGIIIKAIQLIVYLVS